MRAGPVLPPGVLVVVGMRMEAALLPPDVAVVVGTDPGRLEAAAAGASAILSFGICGGLDGALPVGALISATRVRGRGAYAADPGWSLALARATGARPGILAGATVPARDPAAKARLRGATDALAVDLESEAAAACAHLHRLPFAALRAVADTAADTLPRAALEGLRDDGRVAPGRVLLALLRRPGELPALVTVARRTRIALRALRGAVR